MIGRNPAKCGHRIGIGAGISDDTAAGTGRSLNRWRSKAALGEIAFVREFSQSLAEGWSQVGGMVETVLEETTDLQKVRVTTPAGTAGRRFVRLRITRR